METFQIFMHVASKHNLEWNLDVDTRERLDRKPILRGCVCYTCMLILGYKYINLMCDIGNSDNYAI